MEILKTHDPKSGLTFWKTDDGQFSGVIIAPATLREHGGERPVYELPAGALLAVPKDRPSEEPSINKHSPLIAQAPSVEELAPLIAGWVLQHDGEGVWNLRLG